MEILRKDGRCFLCLGKGHKVGQCTVTRRCRHCKKKHHQSICKGNIEGQTADTHTDQTSTTSNPSNVTTSQNKSRVLLQTARTHACSVDGIELLPVRVLFDGGSERSYVTTHLKERLHLKPLKREILNLNTFGTEQYQKKGCDLVKIILKGQDGTNIKVEALTFPTICAPPATAVQPYWDAELERLELADHTDTDGPDSIDVLIGSDHYWDIVTGDVVRGDGPVAVHSKLGWLLSGPLQQNPPHVISNLALQGPYSTPTQGSQDELIGNLQRFWDTESLGITEQSSADNEFEAIIRYDGLESRYVVSLPWTSLEISSNNYKECLTRLNLLKARLLKDKVLLQEYKGTFIQQLQSGIIELVPQVQEGEKHSFYLPHHGVLRQDKETTKLRIVFDGSAKTESNTSLNDCLDKGPNHIPLIFHTLLRFRLFCVGLVADVEKVFHQISIEKSDRDMLRFLWFKDTGSTTDIVHYRFCRLPFGLRSSLAILNNVIQKHLSQYRSSYPHVSKFLADSFYVDDFIGGAASSQEGEEVFNVSRRIMSEGGFNLRKWRTNVLDLQKTISPELDSKVSSHVKVLGLGWNTDSDQLYFDLGEVIKYSCNLPPTKRSLLRLSTKIFDPLGFLSPFVIQLKLLFQQLRVDKINWDYPLEGLALSEWKKLLNELEALSEIRIQRYYLNPNKKIVTSQLHGFCDASTRAYAAVIYLRCFYSDGVVDVNLVTSKTRVAPINGQTVPRLFLCG